MAHATRPSRRRPAAVPASATAAQPAPPRPTRSPWVDRAPVLVAAVWYLAFAGRSAALLDGRLRFPLLDDAMISMRYARQLAAGHGLSWNPGGPAVEGYTNLLWTLWMAALHAVGLSGDAVSLLVMLSSTGLLVGNVVLVRRIARHVAPGSRRAELLSAWGAALCYPLVFWALRGMEQGLVAMLLSASVLTACNLVLRVTPWRAAALAALLVLCLLARDDMLIPVALVIAFVAWSLRGRPGARAVVAALSGATAATLVVHTTVRVAVYGSALPNTYAAKLGGVPLGLRLHTGISWLVPTVVLPLLVPLLLGVAALALRGRAARPHLVLLLGVFATACAYSVYAGGDAWEFSGYANRFVSPAIPLLLVVAAAGLDALLGADARVRRRVAGRLALLATAVAVAMGVEASVAVPQAVVDAGMRPGSVALGALAVAAGLAMVWWWPRPAPRSPVGGPRLAGGAALWSGVAMLAGIATPAVGWAQSNAAWLACDAAYVRLGTALGDATAGRASVGASAAGAIPYWAGGTAVDMLALSDAHVAAESPHAGVLRPGHMKWDIAYSAGSLRPDVIATIYGDTPADDAQLAAWGYAHVSHDVWVRAGTPVAAAVTRAAAPADTPVAGC